MINHPISAQTETSERLKLRGIRFLRSYLRYYLIHKGVHIFRSKFIPGLEQKYLEKRFIRQSQQTPPVIIYQMGKVGSSSIYYSLKKAYPGIVIQTHSFGLDHYNWKIRRLAEICILRGHSLNIITPIREPIGRNISAFFQNFELNTGVPFIKSNFTLLELQELFLKNHDHQLPLEWFEKNINSNFGIDVYATAFPNEGWAIYSNKNIRLLVFRSEIDDDRKKEIVRKYLGLSDFKLIKKNESTIKPYAAVYHQFRKSVVLPSSYIDEMCDSKYFSHFYPNEFVEATRRKWERV